MVICTARHYEYSESCPHRVPAVACSGLRGSGIVPARAIRGRDTSRRFAAAVRAEVVVAHTPGHAGTLRTNRPTIRPAPRESCRCSGRRACHARDRCTPPRRPTARPRVPGNARTTCNDCRSLGGAGGRIQSSRDTRDGRRNSSRDLPVPGHRYWRSADRRSPRAPSSSTSSVT